MLLARESPLNAAHRLKRKAEMCVKYLKFREAIECHKSAGDLLGKALDSTRNKQVIESLKAQIDFHTQQVDLLAKKDQVLQEKLAALEARKAEQRLALNEKIPIAAISEQFRALTSKDSTSSDKSATPERRDSGSSRGSSRRSTTDAEHHLQPIETSGPPLIDFDGEIEDLHQGGKPELKIEISRVIGQYDSLLQILAKRHSGTSFADSEDAASEGSSTDPNSPTKQRISTQRMYKSGYKMAKDDKTIIEELKMNNSELRKLVEQLFEDNERINLENSQLRTELEASQRELNDLKRKNLIQSSMKRNDQLILQPIQLLSHHSHTTTPHSSRPQSGHSTGRTTTTGGMDQSVFGSLLDLPPLDAPDPMTIRHIYY